MKNDEDDRDLPTCDSEDNSESANENKILWMKKQKHKKESALNVKEDHELRLPTKLYCNDRYL